MRNTAALEDIEEWGARFDEVSRLMAMSDLKKAVDNAVLNCDADVIEKMAEDRERLFFKHLEAATSFLEEDAPESKIRQIARDYAPLYTSRPLRKLKAWVDEHGLDALYDDGGKVHV